MVSTGPSRREVRYWEPYPSRIIDDEKSEVLRDWTRLFIPLNSLLYFLIITESVFTCAKWGQQVWPCPLQRYSQRRSYTSCLPSPLKPKMGPTGGIKKKMSFPKCSEQITETLCVPAQVTRTTSTVPPPLFSGNFPGPSFTPPCWHSVTEVSCDWQLVNILLNTGDSMIRISRAFALSIRCASLSSSTSLDYFSHTFELTSITLIATHMVMCSLSLPCDKGKPSFFIPDAATYGRLFLDISLAWWTQNWL